MDRALREHVGIGLAEAERYDVRRFFRGSSWDRRFPADRMVPALRGTLADLGIDLDAQQNVHLDVEERPTKTPRAFCAPIEVPDKVMLVIQPMGGPDDWFALFHEAGHTEHFALTSPDLGMEAKRLGDNAVTEGWAMLLEHLVDDPAWLTRMLDFPRPQRVRRRGRRPPALLPPPLLREAPLRDRVPRGAGRDDAARPLRGAARRCAQGRAEPTGLPRRHRRGLLRHVLPPRVGLRGPAVDASSARSSAPTGSGGARPASLLRELWSLGQEPTADELLKDVTGAPIELEAVAEKIRAALPQAKEDRCVGGAAAEAPSGVACGPPPQLPASAFARARCG